jgi:glycosyltransferase involved in cell wall biosynthesis
MKFSIVIPTYNEEKDIGATLDDLISLDWPDYEIIVVDDSIDRTPEIVATYFNMGVRLIVPEVRNGRCGARNLGIQSALGEIVIILNADVHLPKNFLRLISIHYQNGADYVLVRSVVENIENLFARYIECTSLHYFYDSEPEKMEWTEGFSCRRQIAMAVGLFPDGYPVPLCAGEDGVFGDNLRKIGAMKLVDLSIVCTHIAPSAFIEYWHIRKGRGMGSPQIRRFIEGWSFPRIIARATLRIMRTILMIVSFVPMLWINYAYSKKSPMGFRDILPFCWAWSIEQVAFSVGEWSSIFEIWHAEKLNEREKFVTTR